MKKTNKNLKLSIETIRHLTSTEVATVNGGFKIPIFPETCGTRGLSEVARLCTDSKACPPTVG